VATSSGWDSDTEEEEKKGGHGEGEAARVADDLLRFAPPVPAGGRPEDRLRAIVLSFFSVFLCVLRASVV
jgi:hypothetical protein